MILKEALDYFKYSNIEDIPQSAFNVATESLEQADKYRWHDLRKDPNDLPETFVEVWVCFMDYECCGDEKFYDKAYRRDKDWGWQWDNTLLNKRYEIIAWKKIEPFEEV